MHKSEPPTVVDKPEVTPPNASDVWNKFYQQAKEIAKGVSIIGSAILVVGTIIGWIVSALNTPPGINFVGWVVSQWPWVWAILLATPGGLALLSTSYKPMQSASRYFTTLFIYCLPVTFSLSCISSILFPVFTYKNDALTAVGAVLTCTTFTLVSFLHVAVAIHVALFFSTRHLGFLGELRKEMSGAVDVYLQAVEAQSIYNATQASATERLVERVIGLELVVSSGSFMLANGENMIEGLKTRSSGDASGATDARADITQRSES